MHVIKRLKKYFEHIEMRKTFERKNTDLFRKAVIANMSFISEDLRGIKAELKKIRELTESLVKINEQLRDQGEIIMKYYSLEISALEKSLAEPIKQPTKYDEIY